MLKHILQLVKFILKTSKEGIEVYSNINDENIYGNMMLMILIVLLIKQPLHSLQAV